MVVAEAFEASKKGKKKAKGKNPRKRENERPRKKKNTIQIDKSQKICYTGAEGSSKTITARAAPVCMFDIA